MVVQWSNAMIFPIGKGTLMENYRKNRWKYSTLEVILNADCQIHSMIFQNCKHLPIWIFKIPPLLAFGGMIVFWELKYQLNQLKSNFEE